MSPTKVDPGGHWLDPLLREHALRDDEGHLVTAHLQRANEDYWDCLVVGKDHGPLLFVTDDAGAKAMPGGTKDAAGRTLMVVVATPPGIQPAGILAVPADEHGSPASKLASIVTGEAYTMVEGRHREAKPLPAFGPQMIQTLLKEAAAKKDDSFRVEEQITAHGERVSVLLDWTGKPLRLWTPLPDATRPELATVVATPAGDGLIIMTLNDDLVPAGRIPT